MAGLEAWVTVAIDDNEGLRALVLAESLKRCRTTRQLIVIVGTSVSELNKKKLAKVFDATIQIDSRKNGLSDHVLGQGLCLSVPLVRKCIYLNCNLVAFVNADHLFDLDAKKGAVHFLRNNGGTSFPVIALYTPSEEAFGLTMAKLNAGTISSEWHLGIGMTNVMKDYCCSISDELSMSASTKKLLFLHFEEHLTNGLASLNCEESAGTSFTKAAYKYFEDLTHSVVNQGSDEEGVGQNSPDINDCPIAIVGMACRFAGCENKEQFWNMLMNKENGVRIVPENRWPPERFPGLDQSYKLSKACFMDSIDGFDGSFFGMSPYELEFTDPQQRLLLEVAWESLEDAGINPHSLNGTNTSVFAGSWLQGYKEVMLHQGDPDFYRAYMGNSFGASAGRLSHFLGTTGPNIATESGCSSSMVAVGLGVNNLRRKTTDLALCCGVNLLTGPFVPERFSITSPDGWCKTFDADADGFGRGDGCGVLVLKRLADAVRDNDRIYGQILGYGEAQEGPSSSIGTPTVGVEALAMEIALKDGNTQPHEVSYVECHGTGTQVGDPLEFLAVARVYSSPNRVHPLVIGSVKPNVGHTESCAGITGIIKTVLALGHEVIPPHVGCTNLNPRIDLDKCPAVIPFDSVPWPRDSYGFPRKAGVSSFGITGTDAHLILEEAPVNLLSLIALPTPPLQLLTLSAKSEEALNALIGLYERYLATYSGPLADVTFTANTGRAHLSPWRAAVVGKDSGEIVRKLASCGPQIKRGTVLDSSNTRPKVVFVFSGQGNYYFGMGKGLYENFPVFRQNMDYCFTIILRETGLDFKTLMWTEDPTDSLKLLNAIASFCVQYSTFRLWESFGVKADVVLGHSVGEFAAAAAAGIISCEDALKIAVMRQANISSASGKMLAVKADLETVNLMIKEVETLGEDYWIDISCLNAPTQIVVGGRDVGIEAFETLCQARSIKCSIINPLMALHTRAVFGIVEDFRRTLKDIKFNRPNCTFMSGCLGRVLQPHEMDAEYWVTNLISTVRYEDACHSSYNFGARICIDVGPHPILAPLFSANIASFGTTATEPILCLPSLRKNHKDSDVILESLAGLYVAGENIDWTKYHEGWAGQKISLPSYPFQRKSHWFSQEKRVLFGPSYNPCHPLLGCLLDNPTDENIFKAYLLLKDAPYLEDHKIGNHIIFPGAGYLEIALAAGHASTMLCTTNLKIPSSPIAVRSLNIRAALRLDGDEGTELSTVVGCPDSDGWRNVSTYRKRIDGNGSSPETTWVLHASGQFSQVQQEQNTATSFRPCPELGWCHQIDEHISFYDTLNNLGLKFGPSFKSIQAVLTNGNSFAFELCSIMQNYAASQDNFICHPVVIDAMIQAILYSSTEKSLTQLRIPIGIGCFTWFTKGTPAWIHVDGVKSNSTDLYGIDGTLLARLQDVDTILTSVEDIAAAVEEVTLPLILEIVWEPGNNNSQPALGSPSTIFPSLMVEDYRDLSVLVEQQFVEKFGPGFRDKIISISSLTPLYFVVALHDLGWKLKPGDTFFVDHFTIEHDIPKTNVRMLRRFFEMLAEDGYLSIIDDELGFKILKPLPSKEQAISMADSLQINEPCSAATLQRLKECMTRFLPIIQSKESALPILFPSDAKKLSAENFYRDFPTCVVVNSLLSQVFSSLFQKSSSISSSRTPEPVRILEIGAGTGSATAQLLPILRNQGIHFIYTFTDLSPAFFSNAEAEFGRLEYKILDIEKDPLTQGFSPAQFDLILASNVLHATRDVSQALAHCHLLTRPQGKLVLLEHFLPDRMVDGVFGMLDGFWRFTDHELRRWHPILNHGQWEEAMKSVGYLDTVSATVFNGANGVIVATAGACTKTSFPSEQPEWLILGPNTEIVERISAAVGSCGRRVRRNMDRLSSLSSLEGILYLWGLSPESSQEVVAKGFLTMVHGLSQTEKSKLVVVTVDAVEGSGDNRVLPTSGSLWGLARTVRGEFPADVRTLDIQAEEDVEVQVWQILSEMWTDDDETQIAYRDWNRLCLRGNPENLSTSSLPLPNSTQFCLQLSPLKSIEALTYRALPPVGPIGPRDVDVAVKCAALNFRDIFAILKPIDKFKDINLVAQDSCGIVTAVGSQVTRWKIGDAVIGLNMDNTATASNSFRALDTLLMGLPSTWTFAEGSCLPTVFFTAYHCLVEVAQIKKGDVLLIHTASGGVGIAAIQIANKIGAVVIGTAGSGRKRTFLRQVMGVKHIFHSRNLSYEQDIHRITGGRGVNLVLNSLTSPGFKEASLKVCAKGANFIEMSKLNIWTEDEVRALRPDVKYSIVALETLSTSVNEGLFEVGSKWLREGWLKPIPYTRFNSRSIQDALHYLQKARHVGKVVVDMPHSSMEGGRVVHQFPLFNDRSSYLITGGLGGIGLEVAKWLASSGAKTIILVGRSPPSDSADGAISALKKATPGLVVITLTADVGIEADCRRVLSHIVEHCPPLRGVFHSAGVLSDSLIVNQTWAKFRECYGPKVDGSWNLHSLSLEYNLPLEHFVLFSSGVALVGSMGQSSHASANSYMDALAHYRSGCGLPALSVNWGQWGQVGVAAGLKIPFFSPFTPSQALTSLELAIRSNKTQVAIADVDIDSLRANHPWLFNFFRNIKIEQKKGSVQPRRKWEVNSAQFWEEVAQGGLLIMEKYVAKAVGSLLKLDDKEDVDIHRNFQDLGFDSLMMVELKNSVQTLLGDRVTLLVDDLADCNTVAALSTRLMENSEQK